MKGLEDLTFDSEYTGRRWRYGLTYRPVGFAQVPEGYIINSDKPHKKYRFGTLDYARPLPAARVSSFELELVEIVEGTE